MMNSLSVKNEKSLSGSRKKFKLSDDRSRENLSRLSETFTNFKNARYRLADNNPERVGNYHINNMTFFNPPSPEKKKVHLSPLAGR